MEGLVYVIGNLDIELFFEGQYQAVTESISSMSSKTSVMSKLSAASVISIPGCSGPARFSKMECMNRTIHVQHDGLQCVAVMKAVDPCAVQIGQRGPVSRARVPVSNRPIREVEAACASTARRPRPDA